MAEDPPRDPDTPEAPGLTPARADGDEAVTDPQEMELVAYLDGELEPAAARRVEARLAADPKARTRADALRKTYNLLDFLPRPEPSPTFASRTLDRLPVAGRPPASGPSSVPSSSTPLGLTPAAGSSAGSTGSGFVPMPPRSIRRPWMWGVGTILVLTLAAGAGYFGHAATRTFLGSDSANLSLEEDRRLVENLPLYAGIDDFEFLNRLADGDGFGDDLGVYSDTPPVPSAVAQAAAVQPWAGNPAPLIRAFKALPTARQEQLRELDHKLYELPAADRDRLVRVLEAYAVWLDRLSEAERRSVLSAATPNLRAEVIRDIREGQWKAQLPDKLRKELNATDAAQRADLIQKWKDEETERRKAWLLARKNWDTIRQNTVPWPFAEKDGLRQEVAEFVRKVLLVDGSSVSRITSLEIQRLREAQELAEKNGAWLWYGSVVRELAAKYPTLPEPASGKMVMTLNDLPANFLKKGSEGKKGGERKNLRKVEGRWPEFALAVAEDAVKANAKLTLSLGPSRPDQFREPVKKFLTNTLMPKLLPTEKEALHKLEGHWPEYPRKMLELAKKHDLPIPGITLPGPPSHWEKTYQLPKGGLRSGP